MVSEKNIGGIHLYDPEGLNSDFMKAAILYKTGEPLVVEENIQIPGLNQGQVLVKVIYLNKCT